MDKARSDDPVESSTTLDYLCSQIPAEIRNTIYQLILHDPLPNYVFRHGLATSRPWLGDHPSIVNYLALCSINRQIRAEFGSLLVSTMPLAISANEIRVSFDTFFRRDCLGRVCGHKNHAIVPKQVTILVSVTDFSNRRARNLTDILVVKTNDLNVKIEFTPLSATHNQNHTTRQSADGICALLNRLLGNPPAALLDGANSGLIRGVKFGQGKNEVYYNKRQGWINCQQPGGHRLKLSVRKSSGKLTEEDKNLLCSYCSQVLQRVWPASALRIKLFAWDDRNSPRERWVYCSSSKALLRSL